MGKVLKYAGILFGILLVLFAGALLWIALIFDPNEYKPQISSAVKQATGRELIIDGDIELSLFPWIGMELGKVTLSNAEGFNTTPFAHIDGARVKLALLPLLKQEVQMKTVTLQGLRLNLQVAANGISNWEDLAGASDKAEQQPAETETQAATSGPTDNGALPLAALAIGGLEITDANLSYVDQLSKASYEVSEMNLITGPVSLTDPIDLKLNGRFTSNQPQISGKLDLNARIFADTIKFEHHRVEQLALNLDFDSPEFASRGTISFNSDIDADLATQRYQLNNLKLQGNVANADLPSGKATVNFDTNVTADLNREHIRLANMHLSVYDVNLSGNLEADKFISAPVVRGELAVVPFDGRKLLQTLAVELPEMADPNTLSHIAAKIGVNATLVGAKLDPLVLTLDDSTLQGTLEAKFVDNRPLPALRYTLRMDAIDADRYLPPPSEETAAAPPPAAGAAAAATLPMELLRDLDINGTLEVGKLKVSGLHASDIKLPLKAQNGVITAQPQARLYEGNYKSNLKLDAREDEPVFSLDESALGILAGPLLKDFIGDDLASGKGGITAKLTTRGHEVEQMTRNLNGDISIAFDDGAIKNFNLAQMYREVKAKFNKEPPPPKGDLKGTDFTELRGTFKVINGVIHNDDLATKAPFIRINGAGKVDLVNEKLDYTVNASIVKSAEGEGGAELQELAGIPVPIRIRGSFADPKFDLQYDDIIKAKGKQELERAKTELKARVAEEKAQLKSKLEAEKAEAQLKLEQQRLREQEELKQRQQEQLKEKEEAVKDKIKGLFNR